MAREAVKRSFRYQKRSTEDVKERANARGGGFDSWLKPQYKMFKPRDGKNLIRIMPPTWEGAKHYGYDVYVNYGIGADNQSYLSLTKHGLDKDGDPIADARREAEREGDEKLAKALKPNQRILMWVIDRNAEDEGPQLWAAPFTVDKAIANLSFDEDTREIVYLDDPDEGCDLRFYKEGTGMLTKYEASKMKLQKPSVLCDDEKLQEEWLTFISENQLPDTLNFYDAEHINKAFNGHVRVNDDDDEAKPRTRRQAAADDDEAPAPRRRVAKPDPEDEEPPFEPDDKPAPRRRTRPDPEEDVEEEAPAPRRRAQAKPDPEDEADEEPVENKPRAGSIRDRLRQRSGSKSEDD